MSEDRFLDELRKEGRHLRYEPADDVVWSRLSARVRDRIASAPPGVAELLARWIRPMTATFSALLLAGALVIVATAGNGEPEMLGDSRLGEITVAGDSYSVGD